MEIEHITDLGSALGNVLNSSRGTRITIDKTDWLFDIDLDEVDRMYATLDKMFRGLLGECIVELGPPLYTDEDDRDRVDAWYPEALRLASWRRGDWNLYLALAHQDKEAPIFIELGERKSCVDVERRDKIHFVGQSKDSPEKTTIRGIE